MQCHHYINQHCDSCDLLSLGYAHSVKHKETMLAALFPQETAVIKPSVLADVQQGSRNKAKLAVALVGDDLQFGFYNHAQVFKKLEDCPLHAEPINALLVDLKKLLREFKIKPYQLATQAGELKFVMITMSESRDELLLRFVLRSVHELPRLKKLTVTLLETQPMVKVVTANIQPKHQAVLEGEEEIVLTSGDAIVHHFGEITLLQGPRSFFQTNSAVALRLYQAFQAEMKNCQVKTLLDLYCGVGAFSFFASRLCERVVGVEISEAAINYAKQACVMNHADNCEFIAMDAEVYLKTLAPNSFDAILVNPPRRGLNAAIIDDLLRLSPQIILYSSCNANTLQRDCLQLASRYSINSLRLFDMFPFTSHFETLAVMRLNF